MPGHPNGVQLGGLGAGRIELGRNGRITLAAFTHNPQRLLAGLEGTFFTLRTTGPLGETFHLLQEESLEGFPGAEVDYRGRHPVADVTYRLHDAPCEVSLRAFCPLIPHKLDDSIFPGAHFRFRLRNTSPEPIGVRLGFSWEHLSGCGGGGNRGLSLRCNRDGNQIQPWVDHNHHGLHFAAGSTQAPNHRGDMMLIVRPPDNARAWALQNWNVLLDRPALLQALAAGEVPDRFDGGDLPTLLEAHRRRQASPPSWDDPDPRFGGGRGGIEGSVHPAGVLGVELQLAPGESADIPYALTWHFPNFTCGEEFKGSLYVKRFSDAAASALELLDRAEELEADTLRLHETLDASELPPWLCDKLINDQTALTTNTLIDAGGDLYTLEAAPMMFGALGTLDQRLVSHPGTSWFFPDLNRSELRCFARLQDPDGSLPHFNGNAHTALGSSDVEYGRTGWPDLACSFILQVYRDWVDTGEEAFLQEMRPHIDRAADWLLAADRDGDGVPEGGSSWDIEHYPGCFIATATVWLATLRVLEDLTSRANGNPQPFQNAFAKASDTVASMWTGTHYLKCLDPVTGQSNDDVFVGQLAGEWIVRQLALPHVLPPENVRTALETIYRLNGDPNRYALMPIQVRADGTLPNRKYAWHAWPQYSMVFVDCLALYMGLREPALANLRAFDHAVREINQTPWATTLWHDARTGRPDFESFMGLDWYMNTPAAWWVLPAMSGALLHIPDETLIVNLPPEGESNLPLLTPRCHGRIHMKTQGTESTLTLHLDRVFRGESLRIRRCRFRNTDGDFQDLPINPPRDVLPGESLVFGMPVPLPPKSGT